jgi:hypothetical protein
VVEHRVPLVNRLLDVDWRLDVAKLPVTFAIIVTPEETVVTSAAVVKVRQVVVVVPPPLPPGLAPPGLVPPPVELVLGVGVVAVEDPPPHANDRAADRHTKNVVTGRLGVRLELRMGNIACILSTRLTRSRHQVSRQSGCMKVNRIVRQGVVDVAEDDARAPAFAC